MPEKITNVLYFPMLVSENGTGEQMQSGVSEPLWEKLRHLPDEKRNILVARELPFKIQELQKRFQIAEQGIGIVSLLIRRIFFGELDLPSAEAKIGSLLIQTGGDPNKARDIVQFIDREILHLVPKPVVEESEESFASKNEGTIRMALLPALGKYPRLGEQNISVNRLKLRSLPEPARGSLSNWIRCYRDELGVGFHDQILRGKFLFQSENGKKLSGEERERLSLILKSIEEEFPLEIDTERQVILFPTPSREPLAPTAPAPFANNPLPDSNVRGMNVVREAPSGIRREPLMPFTRAPKTPSFSGSPRVATLEPVLGAEQRTPAFTVARNHPMETAPTKPLFTEFGNTSAKNIAGETLHFSTGHVLPAEHEPGATPPKPPVPPQSIPQAVEQSIRKMKASGETPAPPRRNPYSIRPLRLRNDDEAPRE